MDFVYIPLKTNMREIIIACILYLHIKEMWEIMFLCVLMIIAELGYKLVTRPPTSIIKIYIRLYLLGTMFTYIHTLLFFLRM